MEQLKQIASLLGFQLDDPSTFDINQFKTHFAEKFISKEAVLNDEDISARITGKRLGAFETKFVRAFGLNSEEVKGKKLEEILDTAVSKHNVQLEGLRKKLSAEADERILQLSTQLEEKDKGYQDATKLLGETQLEFENYRNQSDSKFSSYKISDKLSKVYARINFIDGFERDEVRKTGFNTVISKKYQFALDDKDELIVTDNQGDRIKHPTKAGEFIDPQTVLTAEAETNNLLKKNNAKSPTVVSKTIQPEIKKNLTGLPLHKKAAARIKA
ncbi:MAG: hypothetical protein JWO06_2686 [Bacteroidota bacterium]|nr:hypothetical protein [Bacteroidota bacterium]